MPLVHIADGVRNTSVKGHQLRGFELAHNCLARIRHCAEYLGIRE